MTEGKLYALFREWIALSQIQIGEQELLTEEERSYLQNKINGFLDEAKSDLRKRLANAKPHYARSVYEQWIEEWLGDMEK